MKFTDKEVIAIFKKVWEKVENSYGEGPKIDIIYNSESKIRVQLTSMYCPPGLTFAQLMLLSEAFGTKQIDAGEKIDESGCESCDYGSCYGFIVDIKPEPLG